MTEEKNLLAWDDEDGQAYVAYTDDVERAKAYYRDTYLPEIWGMNRRDSEEWKYGEQVVTEGTPRTRWIDEALLDEENWYAEGVHKEPAEGLIPVIIWSL